LKGSGFQPRRKVSFERARLQAAPQRPHEINPASALCDSEHYAGETSADSLITSSQVIITASEIREIVLR